MINVSLGSEEKEADKHHIFFRLPPWIFERKTCFPSPQKTGEKLGAKGYDAILGILDPPRSVRFLAIFITQKMLCMKETSHSRIPGKMDIYIYIYNIYIYIIYIYIYIIYIYVYYTKT